MTSRNTKLPILIVLFVQALSWPLSNGLPAKEAHLSPWDDDDWYPWRRTTTRRPYRDRITPPGIDYPSSSPAPTFVWFILGGFIIISLLALFLKYVCSQQETEPYDSSPTLHPPPARIIRPPDVPAQPPPQNRPPNTRNWNAPFGGGLFGPPESSSAAARVSSTHSRAGDKPPGYSEVVMSDFVVHEKKFPEVSPRPLETPPPKYEDGQLPRY